MKIVPLTRASTWNGRRKKSKIESASKTSSQDDVRKLLVTLLAYGGVIRKGGDEPSTEKFSNMAKAN